MKAGRSVRPIRLPAGVALDLPDGTSVRRSGTADVVMVFVKEAEATADGGVLWVCYPKTMAAGGTDLNRDNVWRLVEEATGWRPVAQVSIDDIRSALRFRPRR